MTERSESSAAVVLGEQALRPGCAMRPESYGRGTSPRKAPAVIVDAGTRSGDPGRSAAAPLVTAWATCLGV
jgi:hypothetical protein